MSWKWICRLRCFSVFRCSHAVLRSRRVYLQTLQVTLPHAAMKACRVGVFMAYSWKFFSCMPSCFYMTHWSGSCLAKLNVFRSRWKRLIISRINFPMWVERIAIYQNHTPPPQKKKSYAFLIPHFSICSVYCVKSTPQMSALANVGLWHFDIVFKNKASH